MEVEGTVPIRSHVIEASGSSKLRMYLLAPSLATALQDSLFEHPDVTLPFALYEPFQPSSWHQPSFSAAC